MTIILSTERLDLRELTPGDAAHLFTLNEDPEVVRHTGDGPFSSPAEARRFLEAYIEVYARDGMGRWAVLRRRDEAFLGWCGLRRAKDGEVDLGFRLHRRYWGNGYATEAARAAIGHGFGPLGLARVIGRARRANPASIRVLEKAGLRRERDFAFEGHPGVLLAIENPARPLQSG